MHPTDLTVAAIVRHDDRYLMVNSKDNGRPTLTQPGGHLDADQGPEQAAIHHTDTATGLRIRCGDLVGTYLWIHPQTRQQFLRIVYAAELASAEHPETTDTTGGIWMRREDLAFDRKRLQSPIVLRCIEDYESGKRESDRLIGGMLPLQHNIASVMACADLV